MNPPQEAVVDDSVLWTIPCPNWKQWDKKHKARLWQAVALLCELEPSRLESFGTPGNMETLLIQHPPKFNSLLGLAITGIGAGLLRPTKLVPEHPEESEIDLTVFASWANATGLAFPDGFPWQPEINLDTKNWPWGRYETELLRKLAQAANRFWKNYDPADISTAPTSEQIVEWLIGQNITRPKAKAIATVLRADGLPTGRRKK